MKVFVLKKEIWGGGCWGVRVNVNGGEVWGLGSGWGRSGWM